MTLPARGRWEPAEFGEDLKLTEELSVASFKLLLRAALYAKSTCQPVWEFAIGRSTLREAGLTDCDVRWLVLRGYLEHAQVVSTDGASKTFASAPATRFTCRSRFVLTPHGVRFVECLLQPATVLSMAPCEVQASVLAVQPNPLQTPLWDGQRRELHLGHFLVKRFIVPAENQEIILSSFQEEAWPPHLDDPLPPTPRIDTKLRLQSAIQRLNRNQKAPLVRFHGDGYGRGICWDLLPPVG